MELESLQRKLADYQNPQLLSLFQTRYLDLHNCRDLTAEEVFGEFKKFILFMYLVQTKQTPLSSFTVIRQLELLDQFWHQFILMTEDYFNFCFEYFGIYIHHHPESVHSNELAQASATDHQAQLKMVIDILGFQTAHHWYVALPRKFTQKRRPWFFQFFGNSGVMAQ